MRRQTSWSTDFLGALLVLVGVFSAPAEAPVAGDFPESSTKPPAGVAAASTLDDKRWQAYRKHLRELRAHYEAKGYRVVPHDSSEIWPLKRYSARPIRTVLMLDEKTGAVVLDEQGKPTMLKEKYVVECEGGCRAYCTTWGAVARKDSQPSIELCHGLTPDAMKYVFGMEVSKRVLYHAKPWRAWPAKMVVRNLADKGWQAYKRRVRSVTDHYQAKGFHLVPTADVTVVPLIAFEPDAIRTFVDVNQETGAALLDERGWPQYREERYQASATNVGSVYLETVTMQAVKDLKRSSPEDVILWQGLTPDATKYAANYENPDDPQEEVVPALSSARP